MKISIDVQHIYLLFTVAVGFNFIPNHDIGSPEYGKDVVDGLNKVDKNIKRNKCSGFLFLRKHK